MDQKAKEFKIELKHSCEYCGNWTTDECEFCGSPCCDDCFEMHLAIDCDSGDIN